MSSRLPRDGQGPGFDPASHQHTASSWSQRAAPKEKHAALATAQAPQLTCSGFGHGLAQHMGIKKERWLYRP
eukprot:scaffold26653_cov18-Tisochrysis_lutea.AAC.1